MSVTMMYKCVKNYGGHVKYLCRRKSSFVESLSVDETNIRPFEEIPGPKGLPFFGSLHKYLPIIGEYDLYKMHVAGAKKLASYGPLVKETIAGQTIVWVFRPEDIAKVFQHEYGKIPARKSHLALEKYRKDRSSIYNHGGLIPTNGEEWRKIRKEFQKLLSKPTDVTMYLNSTNPAVDEFIEVCKEEDREDISPILARLFLEMICMVGFDEKMNSFSQEEMREDSKTSKLIESALLTNSAVLKLDGMFRLWRYFDTPLYKTMCRAHEFMESFALEMVHKKKMELSNSSQDRKLSLLATYLLNPALNEKDVVGMACDMLLGGVDTTLYSVSFLLYHLSTNLDKQEKLHQEAITLLPNKDDPVTDETLQSAKYVKAVVKESFRLNPISFGVGRITQCNMVLSGYEIPKGTNVVFQNQIISRLPEYFDQPDSFIPERWLRDKSSKLPKQINPHVVLPFGHGSRNCIARRLAEQNMYMILLKMCRNLKFTWRGGKLDIRSYMINKPDGPINLEFEDRSPDLMCN